MPTEGFTLDPLTRPHRSRQVLFAPPIVLSLVSMAWTTVCLGDLFGGSAFTYTIAVAFDLTWATSIFLEWQRPSDAKRNPTEIFGWVALAISMILIVVHGILMEPGDTVSVFGYDAITVEGDHGDVLYGLGGATIPAFTKAVWYFVLKGDPERRRKIRAQELEVIKESAEYERRKAELRDRQKLADLVSVSQRERDELSQIAETAELKQDLQYRLALKAGQMSPPTYELSRADVPERDKRVPAVPVQAADQPGHLSHPSQVRPELVALARDAKGASQLVGLLREHGVPRDQAVAEAVQLRPDLNVEALRKAVQRKYTDDKSTGTGLYM